ncbi:unnamed protein product [Scytosiphon promiscuus]
MPEGKDPRAASAFDEDVSAPLATAVIRSLRFFRAAAAGTEAASIPGEDDDGEGGGGGGGHTPAVTIRADGSIAVDDGHRRVALAGLRLAGAVATAPGPARALLEAGGFHVLWRLPLDPAATPMGVALALGALCQGIRHADVLRVFLTRLGGYEACASVLSRQVAHPAALSRGRSIMQYVALVECLQLVRTLAAKVGLGPTAVKGMEELAHALGALEALLSEGAGDTSASGIQPGIRKGDRKRRLQGFEVLLAKADAESGDGAPAAPANGKASRAADNADPNVAAAISDHLGREAARDKRPRGGLAPSLVALLWEHQLPAALAAGVAAAAFASEKGAAASAAAPRSTAALTFALDPSALATPVGPEGSATMEALADGLDESLVTPGGLARLLIRSCQALSAADLALSAGDAAAGTGGSGTAEGGGAIAGGGGKGAGGNLFGGAEGETTAALRKLHELGPSLAGRSSACEVICRYALPAVLNPPPGGGRASVTVTTSLLLWVLEADQESCSDVLAERWGALRSRVSALSAAGEVGWSDSLSYRLYLFHKAMDMSKGGASGDLPRAGEMMAGLARQSQTLAVYIGLEDAPDVSGAPWAKPGAGGSGPATDADPGADGAANRKPPASALQPRTEEERRRAAAPVIIALTLRLKVLALAASRGLGASYPAFAGGAAVPALAGLPAAAAPPASAPAAASQPPRLKDPSKEPLLLVGDLFTTPGPGEAEEGELRWEQEDGAVVSEQRGLEAAEHEARLLACAVPALRLLRHCLGRLSDAGAQPPVGPLDAVGALLDFEAALAMLPLHTPSPSPPPGIDRNASTEPGDFGATPTVALALRAEALVLSSCRLWCPPRPWSRLRNTRGGGGGGGSFLHRVSAHALACPANHMSGARLLAALLPPESPSPLHRMSVPLGLAGAPGESSGARKEETGGRFFRRDLLVPVSMLDSLCRGCFVLRGIPCRRRSKRHDAPSSEAAAGGSFRLVLVSTFPIHEDRTSFVAAISCCYDATTILEASSPVFPPVARPAVSIGPMTAKALCAALVRSLIGCIERYIGQSQPLGGRSEKDREVSWEPVCRVLAVILAIADNPRSGAGRVGLLLGGAIEALMPCLGLPRPEVIRSALEVLCSFVEGSRVSEVRRYSEPACSFGTLATAARNVVAKWHRVDLHVHAWGARLLATLAAQPSVAADALQALQPRGAEAAGVEAQEGKTTMLLPRLYAGLQKGLEDTGNRYKHRLSLLKGGKAHEQKGLELDRRVLRLVRAACWAIQVPLALMEEGLVDAAVVAGVLSPKGKASPQEEPLFKIKAAAEAPIDASFQTSETHHISLRSQRQNGARTSKNKGVTSAILSLRAERNVVDPGCPASCAHCPRRTFTRTRERYLLGLVNGAERLWAACEAVRGTSTSRNPPAKEEGGGVTATAEDWFSSTSRKLVATWQVASGLGGFRSSCWCGLWPGRQAWLERGPCMGRGRLPAVMSDEGLATALSWRTETAEMEKVLLCCGFLQTTADKSHDQPMYRRPFFFHTQHFLRRAGVRVQAGAGQGQGHARPRPRRHHGRAAFQAASSGDPAEFARIIEEHPRLLEQLERKALATTSSVKQIPSSRQGSAGAPAAAGGDPRRALDPRRADPRRDPRRQRK